MFGSNKANEVQRATLPCEDRYTLFGVFSSLLFDVKKSIVTYLHVRLLQSVTSCIKRIEMSFFVLIWHVIEQILRYTDSV